MKSHSFSGSRHPSEDAKTEFKASFGKEAIETLVAFANGTGGTLWVGMADDGRPLGIDAGEETVSQWLNMVKTSTAPSIFPDAETMTVEGRQVVQIRVAENPVKPVSFKGRYFIRRGRANHQMTLAEIAQAHMRSINLSWDFSPDPLHDLADLSLEKVNRFIEVANRNRDHLIEDDPMTVLRKFELIRERPTIGCVLLFGQAPTMATTIEAVRFGSGSAIKDSRTIRDDLFAEVGHCLEFLHKHMDKSSLLRGHARREEVWEYPPEAIREIVINMIIHRDYRSGVDSAIRMFDDRIEFFNAGPLPEGLSLPDILAGRTASMARNKQIATLFKEAGLVEKYGSGIRRVCETMQAAHAQAPAFEILGECFKVTLFPLPTKIAAKISKPRPKVITPAKGVNEGVNEGVSEGVNEGVNEGVTGSLLALIGRHPGLRAPSLADRLGTSVKSLERHLRALRQAGRIVFRGPPKTGGYHRT